MRLQCIPEAGSTEACRSLDQMKKTYRERSGCVERVASGLHWCMFERFVEFHDDGLVTMYTVVLRAPGPSATAKRENELRGHVTRSRPPNLQGDREIEFEVESDTLRIKAEAIELGTGELICGFVMLRKDLDVGGKTTSHLFQREQ